MKYLILAGAVLMAGCASAPIQTGRNSYMLEARSCAITGCLNTAMQAAQKHCASMGKRVLLASAANGNGMQASATIQYKCVDLDDERDSILRPDHGVEEITIHNLSH